jgi:hypothetical protein
MRARRLRFLLIILQKLDRHSPRLLGQPPAPQVEAKNIWYIAPCFADQLLAWSLTKGHEGVRGGAGRHLRTTPLVAGRRWGSRSPPPHCTKKKRNTPCKIHHPIQIPSMWCILRGVFILFFCAVLACGRGSYLPARRCCWALFSAFLEPVLSSTSTRAKPRARGVRPST